jgi:hypothetical protein
LQEHRTAAGRLSITRTGSFSSFTYTAMFNWTWVSAANETVANRKEQVDKKYWRKFARHTCNLGLN